MFNCYAVTSARYSGGVGGGEEGAGASPAISDVRTKVVGKPRRSSDTQKYFFYTPLHSVNFSL
jgi:hypothetical protein